MEFLNDNLYELHLDGYDSPLRLGQDPLAKLAIGTGSTGPFV